MKRIILNILLLTTIVLMVGCTGIEETKQVVVEGDFIYRLVTEKAEYIEDGPIKIYAELEYVGDKEQIQISHAASPFSFPMVETTRNYEIWYSMNLPEKSTIIYKGEPLREEYTGGSGGYGSKDDKDYVEFMKQVMKKQYPRGHYKVNGVASFSVIGNEETGQKKRYNIKAQVGFDVISSD